MHISTWSMGSLAGSAVRITAGLLLVVISTFAAAQDAAGRPIKWLVPYVAGGGADVVARLYARQMEQSLKQPIVIENRPGGASVIGIQALKAAPADGLTIISGNDSFASNLFVLDKPPYTLADFSGVSVLNIGYMVLVSRPDFPARNAGEVFRYIKDNEGKLTYASWGIGGTAHLTMEALLDRVGARLVHVPFPGALPAIIDPASTKLNQAA